MARKRSRKQSKSAGKGKARADPKPAPQFGPGSFGDGSISKGTNAYQLALLAYHRLSYTPSTKYPSVYEGWLRDLSYSGYEEEKGNLTYYVPAHYAGHIRSFIFRHRVLVELVEHWEASGLFSTYGPLTDNPLIGQYLWYLETMFDKWYRDLQTFLELDDDGQIVNVRPEINTTRLSYFDDYLIIELRMGDHVNPEQGVLCAENYEGDDITNGEYGLCMFSATRLNIHTHRSCMDGEDPTHGPSPQR